MMTHLRSPFRQAFLLAAVSLSLLLPAVATSQEEAHSQFWPELDVFYRFDAQWRLFAMASVTREREIQYTDWAMAVHLDYSFFPLDPLIGVVATDYEKFRLFQFRVGYYYSHALGDYADGYVEHRGIVEGSIRLAVTDVMLISDRSRLDLRSVNSAFSSRYRNRIRVERQTETDVVTLNPFLSAEFFYDSRYEAWSRQIYSVGVEWTLSGGTVLETSYQRQNDSRPSSTAVSALALTISLYF